MKQSSPEVNSRLAGQEIPHLLWNGKVYYRVHTSPLLPTGLCPEPHSRQTSTILFKGHTNENFLKLQIVT
jgi:hypothetical protein